jgi:hypothetical protein
MTKTLELGRWTRSLALAGLMAGFVVAPAVAEDSKVSDMQLHHLHLMINHSVEMAAEGANLMMLGKMGMAKDADEQTIKHGKAMIGQAKEMLNRALAGDAMKKLHEGDAAKSAQMAYTHKLGDSAKAYINELDAMK